MQKMPPTQKFYEAYTAIADGRVHPGSGDESTASAGFGAAGSATVASSDGSKAYHVAWNGDEYASDDNATYWQGYPGYPVLAVLMLQGRLPFDLSVARRFRGIPWKQLNDAHKGDYDAAFKEACELKGLEGFELELCANQAKFAYAKLEGLDLHMRRKLG